MAEKTKAKKNRERTGHIDWLMVAAALILVVFGLLMVYSASSYNAHIKWGDSAYFLKKQLQAAGVGLAALFLAALIPYEFWRSGWSYLVYIISIILTLLVLSPLGFEANGAYRWLDLRFFTLQPSEVVKVGLILIMAVLLSKYKDYMGNIKAFFVVFLPTLLAAGVVGVVTDDLGTAIIIFAMGLIMIAVICPEKKYVILTILVIVALGIIFVLVRPNKRLRIKSWLNLEQYADDEGYQIMQALYAIGSGGLFGKGIGKSTQKMGFVPESENDMIFSVICEELGIFGAILLLALFALLIWRMWKLYRETDDLFGKLIVAGVMSHLAVQTIINMCVVTSLLPNTGVPLPFISYGGSSIMMTLLEIGLVLSVSRNRRSVEKVEQKKPVIREDKKKGVIYYR